MTDVIQYTTTTKRSELLIPRCTRVSSTKMTIHNKKKKKSDRPLFYFKISLGFDGRTFVLFYQ